MASPAAEGAEPEAAPARAAPAEAAADAPAGSEKSKALRCMVKVENVSPVLQEASLRQFFGAVGTVKRLQWTTSVESLRSGGPRECFLLFEEPRQALLASLLHETEFADRPLKVSLTDADFPEDPAQVPQPLMVPGLSLPLPAPLPGFGLFPYGMPVPGVSMIAPGLPGPVPGLALPMLPGGFPLSLPLPAIGLGISPPAMLPGFSLTPSMQDPVRLDEMARTIYIGNIGPGTREEDLIRVFSTAGPVAYVKMAGDPTQLNRFAFLEYVDVASANNALTLNNYNVDGRILKVSKSKNTIVKPPKVTAQNARQVDDILRKVREAQTRIAQQYEQSLKAATGTKPDAAAANGTTASTPTSTPAAPATGTSAATEGSSSRRRRSRSRSPDRRRRHSNDRSHRDRSRERARDRSRERRRSRSRGRDRSRSRDRGKERDKTKEKEREKEKDKDKEKEKEKEKEREKDKEKEKEKDKDKDKEKEREKDKERDRERDRHRKRSRSRSGSRERRRR